MLRYVYLMNSTTRIVTAYKIILFGKYICGRTLHVSLFFEFVVSPASRFLTGKVPLSTTSICITQVAIVWYKLSSYRISIITHMSLTV